MPRVPTNHLDVDQSAMGQLRSYILCCLLASRFRNPNMLFQSQLPQTYPLWESALPKLSPAVGVATDM